VIPYGSEAAVVHVNGGESWFFNDVLYNTNMLTGHGIQYHDSKSAQSHVALSATFAHRGIEVVVGTLVAHTAHFFVPHSGSQTGFAIAGRVGATIDIHDINATGRGDIHILVSNGTLRAQSSVLGLMDGTVALSGGNAATAVASRGALRIESSTLTYDDATSVSLTDHIAVAEFDGRLTFDTATLSYTAGGLGDHVFVNGGVLDIQGTLDTFVTNEGSYIALIPAGGRALVEVTNGAADWAVATRNGGAGDEVLTGDTPGAPDSGTGQTNHVNANDSDAGRVFTASYTGVVTG
jgi:hypothetical protein